MREWLMKLLAGSSPYWISDAAARQFASLHGAIGGGAAIALVDAVKRAQATSATFTLDGWQVTVSKTDDQ